MTHFIRKNGAVLAVTAMLLGTATASHAAAPNAAQAACLLAANKAIASVAKAEGKNVAGCVKAAPAGKLVEPTISACIDGDAKGKVAKAHEKAAASVAKACTEAPPFGVSDLTGATLSTQSAGVRKNLVTKLFGSDLDATFVAKSSDAAGAACQGALMKAIDKCWAARMSAFSACAATELASPTVDAASFGACRSSDPEGEVAAACVTGIQDALDKKCAGADLDALVPGCTCRYPQDCVQVALANAGNRLISAAAQLPAAETVVPFARTRQAADTTPWISPVYGEYVASRVVGRTEAAELACPLGALNIYDILDVQADIDYTNGIVPYIIQQGIRILIQPRSASDVTGTSPANLVHGTQAMPLYAEAKDFLRLATRREVKALAPLKAAEVGDTLNFGFEHCLHDCAALYAQLPPPTSFGFSGKLLAVHFTGVDRTALEAAIPGLVADLGLTTGVRLRWVGTTIADFKLELPDGSVHQAFNRLSADGSLVYEIDNGVDPSTQVLTLPSLASFLGTTSSAAVVLLQ